MTDAAPRATRINTGLYTFSNHNGLFEVELFPDGAWMLFRITQGEGGAEQREFERDFCTKNEALRWAHSGNAWEPDESEMARYDGAGNLRPSVVDQHDLSGHFALCSARDGLACDCDGHSGEPGWKLVPVVPTAAMVEAGQAYWNPERTPSRKVWDAMLSAAPTPAGHKDDAEWLRAEFARLYEAARGCEFDLKPADGPIARLTLFVHENGCAISSALSQQRVDASESATFPDASTRFPPPRG